MNVLILGSGGREHTLAWKIAQSPLLNKLFICPGNAGTEDLGMNIPASPLDFKKIEEVIIENKIGLLVVGPEQPLAEGIRDYFENRAGFADLLIIGPGKHGATLESSKDFAKAFMERHNIPSAASLTVKHENLETGVKYLENSKPPYVLKADGLAAGKGVMITEDLEEAKSILNAMILDKKFGEASSKVVIEEFLKGIELSVFVLTDGKNYVLLPEAKDYKRIGEGDTGLNTGGMGSVSPVPFADKAFMERVEKQIVKPTIDGLASDNIPYTGFIFFGLMNVAGNPYVIEYNVRMGDPETQSVLPRIIDDLLELLIAAGKGELANREISISPEFCTSVILASGGYPGSYEKGKLITGLKNTPESLIFHAGTMKDGEGKTRTSGGRVLAITSMATSLEESMDKCYDSSCMLEFDKKYFRRDIGRDLLKVR